MSNPSTANRSAAQKGNRNDKRGRAWEDIVATLVRRVPTARLDKTTAPFRIRRGKAANATGAFEGHFERRGQCDFVGWFQGIHVELEAKRTAAGVWRFSSSIKPHQWDRLRDADADGCLAGVLLMTDDGCGMFGIRFRALANTVEAGKKSISVDDLGLIARDPFNSGIFDLQDGGLGPFLRELHQRRRKYDDR